MRPYRAAIRDLLLIALGLVGLLALTYRIDLLGWLGSRPAWLIAWGDRELFLALLYLLVALQVFAWQRLQEHRALGIALRREHAFTDAIVDTAGGLIVVLDRQGRIVRFNRACERLTGYRAVEVLGRPFSWYRRN